MAEKERLKMNEDSYAIVRCAVCQQKITRDDNGNLPVECPRCGFHLKYIQVPMTSLDGSGAPEMDDPEDDSPENKSPCVMCGEQIFEEWPESLPFSGPQLLRAKCRQCGNEKHLLGANYCMICGAQMED